MPETGKIFGMPMLSSSSLKYITVWSCGVEGNNQGSGGDQRPQGNSIVDRQHGTDVEGNSCPLHKGLLPQVRYFSLFITKRVLLFIIHKCCKYASGAIHIFLLCRFKINNDGDKKTCVSSWTR